MASMPVVKIFILHLYISGCSAKRPSSPYYCFFVGDPDSAIIKPLLTSTEF